MNSVKINSSLLWDQEIYFNKNLNLHALLVFNPVFKLCVETLLIIITNSTPKFVIDEIILNASQQWSRGRQESGGKKKKGNMMQLESKKIKMIFCKTASQPALWCGAFNSDTKTGRWRVPGQPGLEPCPPPIQKRHYTWIKFKGIKKHYKIWTADRHIRSQ